MFMGLLPNSQFGDVAVVSGVEGIDTFVPVEVFNSINESNIGEPPLNGTHTPVFSRFFYKSGAPPSIIKSRCVPLAFHTMCVSFLLAQVP